MATEIRLEGALLNRAINDYDISKIQSATNKSDVESLWGKITDWFCGTRKEEAKKALFDVIHNDNPDRKIECFNQLRDMVSPAYKDKFTYKITEVNDNLFTVNLLITDILSIENLSTTGKSIDITSAASHSLDGVMNRGDFNLEQLKKDATRFTYTLNSKLYKHGFLTELELEKITVNMPKAQKKSLDVIASQTGVIAIKNGIHELGCGMSFVGTPELQSISISTKKDDVVKVELNLIQNHLNERFDIYKQSLPDAKYPCLSMKANIDIDNKGNYYIREIKVSHPGID